MAIKIVSDLHGATEALREEVARTDTLLLLGDLINVIDYTTRDGILVEMFGVEAVNEVISLRAEKRFEEARAVMAKRREGREQEVADRFEALFRKSYREFFTFLSDPTYLIFGIVDRPAIVDELCSEVVHLGDC